MDRYYSENPDAANGYRAAYVDSIETLIRDLTGAAAGKRDLFMKDFLKNPDEYRARFFKLLGKPLSDGLKKTIPTVEKEFVARDGQCEIYRLSLRTEENWCFYGLLMIPHGVQKAPLVIAQHGGGGTPELCSDMHGKNNYNRMVRRLLEKKAVVFAPQLLLWNLTKQTDTMPKYTVPYDRFHLDKQLKHYGYSIVSLEIYLITQSLNYLETLSVVEKAKIGMTGISYGGFFTLYTMAADKRIQSGYSCACFNDRTKYGYADWVWKDSANRMLDAEVAALCAPRRLYLEVGREDTVFDYKSAVPEAARAERYYQALGCADMFKFDVCSAGHTVNSEDTGYNFFFRGL